MEDEGDMSQRVAQDGDQSRGKEVRLMAKPIESTPVMAGDDLKQLLEDVKKPDLGRENRKAARELLRKLTSGGGR